MEKILKSEKHFMLIFGTILGIFLFTVNLLYGDHNIIDSMGISLIGFSLPFTVIYENYKYKK